MSPLCYAAKFDPFLSLDCARVEGAISPSGNLDTERGGGGGGLRGLIPPFFSLFDFRSVSQDAPGMNGEATDEQNDQTAGDHL